MGNRNMKIIGAVGTIAGAGVTIFGVTKYQSANVMYKTSKAVGVSADIWDSHMSDYKIYIIIGAIVLLIGAIVLISGFLVQGKQNQFTVSQEKEGSTSEKLAELQKMLNANLISKDEYERKRKEIIDKM